MFKKTYKMTVNYDHIGLVETIFEMLGIKIEEGSSLTKVQDFYVIQITFKARTKEIEVLKTKLNKYGLTVA